MAKKRKIDEGYSSAAEFPNIQAELVDASDRAAAIVGAAAIDVQLERLLGVLMIEDSKEVGNLIGGEPGAPLGSFSARIRACYCLGLITRATFDDLNRIRRIRNIFAHQVLGCSFAHPAVRQICHAFSLLNMMIEVGSGSSEWSSRTRFVMTVHLLETLVRNAFTNTQARKSPGEIAFKGPHD